MSYVALYRSRRRRRLDWRPIAAAAVLVAGVVAVVLVAPARRQETAAPEPAPAVGLLLHAGQDSAIVRGTLALSGGDMLVAVRFLRGPHRGVTGYRVTGCPDGGELIDTTTGAARAWVRGEAHIFSLIARAACGEPGTPLERT